MDNNLCKLTSVFRDREIVEGCLQRGYILSAVFHCNSVNVFFEEVLDIRCGISKFILVAILATTLGCFNVGREENETNLQIVGICDLKMCYDQSFVGSTSEMASLM